MWNRSREYSRMAGGGQIGISQQSTSAVAGVGRVDPGARDPLATVVWSRVDIALDAFLQRIALVIPTALRMSLALVFVWWGIQFVRFGWDQTSELAELPMAWIFMAWPVAGVTWVLFLGEAFIKSLPE